MVILKPVATFLFLPDACFSSCPKSVSCLFQQPVHSFLLLPETCCLFRVPGDVCMVSFVLQGSAASKSMGPMGQRHPGAEGKQVYVGNLSWDTEWQALKVGNSSSVALRTDAVKGWKCFFAWD